MISATVNLGGVLGGLKRLEKTDRRKIFGSARKPSRADQRDHAKKQEEPDGKWKPLASSTIERRARSSRRRSKKILGRLPAALQMKHDANRLVITSRATWSNIHNRGGRAGHGSRIPRRRFLWLSKALVRSVRDLFTAALQKSWGNRA